MIEFKRFNYFLTNAKLLADSVQSMGKVFIHWDSNEGGCRLAYRSAVYIQNAIRANLASGGAAAGRQYTFIPLSEATITLRRYYGWDSEEPGVVTETMLNAIQVIKTGPRSYKVGIPADAKSRKTLYGPFHGAMAGKKGRAGKVLNKVQDYAERFEFGATWTHPFTLTKVYQPARPFFYPAIRKFLKDSLDPIIGRTLIKDLDKQITPLYQRRVTAARSIDLGRAVAYSENF